MITPIEPECVLSDRVFGDALGVVERSGAATLIDSYAAEARGAGGRPRAGGVRYTMTAVLVALMARIMLTRTPSIRGVLATIADFTDTQQAAVGMTGAPSPLIRADYKRFHDWLTTQLTPLDSHHDLPARRVRNDRDRQQRAARTAEVLVQQAAALERSRIVTNRIIAGSILDPIPPKCRGDVVADGTILDLSGPTNLGVREDRMRGAAPMGRFYARTSANTVHTGQGSPGQLRKAGYGIEITAITRIGQPDALHAVAPVITGIDIHTPTSGSVEGLSVALRFHQENGFDNRVGGRARWPRLVIDMGYNTKTGFGELMLDLQYAAVARYPKHWSKLHVARNPQGSTNPVPPGVIQGYGAFYCEAATPLLAVDNLLKPTRDWLTARAFRAHDERLAALLPLLVGVNSKPKYGRPHRGRPSSGNSPEQVVKLEIVCPAVQLRVRCPHKPDSMTLAPMEAPTVSPAWVAEERTLCRKSSTTVTLTDDQLRMAQFDLVPVSWEHALYFEAARALTEQRFGFLKNPHITGISDLIWGPKREPILKVIIACAIAVANLRSQQAPADRPDRTESIQVKWRRLARDLGREPTRTPPRT
ncbi:hypothetical protein [Mycobacteroides abscessus]|uniref:hypothetical protein n=1 Tax=Mycobacteroides abscessus TaxID=36809 RepID=UPI0017851953|nr:hypothetical protein [Mycobacteroides abscessus]MBE5462799.1 hypothetical protein [Mycobacteroides abscessus]QOF41050.1 hypothetical protein E3G69_000060 [Mycobacteroides abscessus]QOF45749.1 hypothetical protein E3G70_000059 [Mycobacteroides abscessus]